jgi:hypothetical protein
MAMSGETISAIVGSVAASGVLAGLINAISNKRKTGADATKVITDAALGIVTQLQARIKELLEEVSDLKAREDARDQREDQSQRALMKHHQWDLELVSIINQSLPDHKGLLPPPPLFEGQPWHDNPNISTKKDPS